VQRYVLGRLAKAVPLLLLITLLVFGLTLLPAVIGILAGGVRQARGWRE